MYRVRSKYIKKDFARGGAFTKQDIKRIKKRLSKRVKCVEDDKEFDSITDAKWYYNISNTTIAKSFKENRKVYCKSQDKMLQFILLDQKESVDYGNYDDTRRI